MSHRFFLAVLLGLMVVAAPVAAQIKVVPPEVLATIMDDEPALPRSMTAGERARWSLPEVMPRGAPPVGAVRTPPEYAANDALFLRWGSFNSVVTEISVAVTTETSDARIKLIVSGSSQANSAASILSVAGADLDRVDFLTMPSDSVWIRDYGPRSLFVNNQRALMDHTYNRPRFLDNQVPAGIAALTGENLFDLPLVHGGGNFHLFGNGQAFMTDLIGDENPGLDDQQIIDFYAAYHNLDLTLLDPLPASYDSTQHIDMWMLPVDSGTVIVGQYDSFEGSGIPNQVSEAAVTIFKNRGYNVLRTPGWRSSGAHFTYTNSVIINEAVLLCQFNGFPIENAAAAAVFEQAFPDHLIVAIDCSNIIFSAGAIHCIVMHYARLGDSIFGDRFRALSP